MNDIQTRIKKLRELIPDSVKIIAVSKKKSAEAVLQASACGLTEFGENFLQEAQDKQQALLGAKIHWHFIGNLQRKKVKDVVGRFSLIHSVDSLRLAEEINKRCQQKSIQQDVLIQTNFAGESTKNGILRDNFTEDAGKIIELSNLRVRGVMDMPPLFENTGESEVFFREHIQYTTEEARKLGWPIELWSLGTSSDFEAAIRAGSNMVRLGTSVFGPRE